VSINIFPTGQPHLAPPISGAPVESLLRAGMKQTNPSAFSNALKGELGEARTALTMRRAGFEELPGKLPGNQGFDGVWIKRAPDGTITQVYITESKFASDGVFRLGTTKTMGPQMSNQWIRANNIDRLQQSANPALQATGDTLDAIWRANRGLITKKGALLDPNGILRFQTLP
jgi:hypothetical protein